MRIEISAALDDQAIVRNLFALYAHDMSEFVDVNVGDDGRFVIPASLASYFEGPDAPRRFPFLVRADGRLAGFALVRQIATEPVTYDMGEFFSCGSFAAPAWDVGGLLVVRSFAGCGVRGCRRASPPRRSGAASSPTAAGASPTREFFRRARPPVRHAAFSHISAPSPRPGWMPTQRGSAVGQRILLISLRWRVSHAVEHRCPEPADASHLRLASIVNRLTATRSLPRTSRHVVSWNGS